MSFAPLNAALSCFVTSSFTHFTYAACVDELAVYTCCCPCIPYDDTQKHMRPHARVTVVGTVTGEALRGEERGPLNNECAEPCYTDEPLK